MGLTSTFYIAQRGLQVSQLAMETVSHNISNVNTPGYSRQSLDLITTIPSPSRIGPLGTGVDASSISRAHDEFITRNLIEKNALLAKYEAQKLGIDALESVFNETMGNGINEALSEFWNAWQDLANNPEGSPERANLLEKADTLARTINTKRGDMDAIRMDINRRMEEAIIDVNNVIREVAGLNEKIVAIEAGHLQNANDLRDKRDVYLQRLAEYMNITHFEDSRTGAVSVLTPSGTPLVADGSYWTLKAATERETGDINIEWERTSGGTVDITDTIRGGQIGGWLELRDEIMDDFYKQLESFTEGLITEINRQHSQGAGLIAYEDLTSSYSISEYATYKTELAGTNNDFKFTSTIPGDDGERINIRFVKASSPEAPLSLVTTSVPGPLPGDPPESITIMVTLPINKNGQYTATAGDVAKLINDQRTPGLTLPVTYPPPGPPYLAGDLIQAELARGETGQGIVQAPDPNQTFQLDHSLRNVLDFGDQITYAHEYARLETKIHGDNNDLIYSVSPDWLNANPNLTGEEISIQYVDVGGAGPPTVTVVGTRIIVNVTDETRANDIVTQMNTGGGDWAVMRGMVRAERAEGNTGGGIVEAMPEQWLDRSGSFDLVVHAPDGTPSLHTITVRPTDTKDDIISQINNIDHISAGDQTEGGKNFLRIQTNAGYSFSFGNDSSNALMALGLNTFFSGSSASSIGLNSVINDNPMLMATGRIDRDGLTRRGDNVNALDLADIKDKKLDFYNQRSTLSEAYNTLAADIGATTHAITRNHDFNATLIDQISAQRDMVAAVNLDEEMADLLKFQYMFQASAKMISAVDEMLQTLMAVK
jgi:flagellar hook-associated protein 1